MSLLLAQATTTALPMVQKLHFLHPEIVLFIATVAVLILGSSPARAQRALCTPVTVIALIIAGILGALTPTMPGAPLPGLINFMKPLIAGVGVLLTLLVTGTVDEELEQGAKRGIPFSSLRSNRGEFYAFFLFSLAGLMLTTTADDLIWLFLALELTSLPTYVMVAISTREARSQEAGVKYFFLGAFGAAIFLFGFTLLYGATGTTQIFAAPGQPSISLILAHEFAVSHAISPIAMLGLVLAIVGVSFKIAAVPMHFYTPDVYQGAATPVTAMLAFVPKAAGFVALILLLTTVGWHYGELGHSLPEPIRVLLWVIAALTMTVGNVLAWLQTSVKRLLAYSSIANSGYMLVGLVAGPGAGGAADNGLAATLFYLLCYGFMGLGAFAVLACIEREARAGRMEEIESVDDLRGLCATHPVLGWTMVLCAASLIGFPPLLGFFGKLYLFTAGVSAREYALVVILGINSAMAAFYYLRLVAYPLLEDPTDQTRGFRTTRYAPRVAAAVLAAACVVLLIPAASSLMNASNEAVRGTTGPVASEPTQDATAQGGTSGLPRRGEASATSKAIASMSPVDQPLR